MYMAQAAGTPTASPNAPPPDAPTAPSATHRYLVSSRLRAELESRRYTGKWGAGADLKHLPDANDRIIRDGGFSLDRTQVAVPKPPPAEWVAYPPDISPPPLPPRFSLTELCCANIDTLTAALALGDACALSFANPVEHGGRYRHGARAQEEDLCRLLPQLYASLAAAAADGEYPIRPDGVLVSRGLLAVRRPGSYELCEPPAQGVTILTAAMPCGAADHGRPKGG